MNRSETTNDESGVTNGDTASLQEMRIRRTSPRPDGRDAYEQLKQYIAERLFAYLDDADRKDVTVSRSELVEQFNELLVEERIVLRRSERRQLIDGIFADLVERTDYKP